MTKRRDLTRAAASVLAATLMTAVAGGAMAQSCPDIALTGAPLQYDASQLTNGLSFDVVAGGNIDLGTCGSVPGFGYIIEGPDFELSLSGMSPGQSLTLSVAGDCDTVLLVNDATAEWFYNDDDTSLDPAITIEGAANGVYDIWVGTYGPETCPALLTISTGGAGGAGAATK
jgi:hypothetical protein